MNQAMQTHMFTPLFASAVHPCRVPYAQSIPKKAKGTFEVWSPSIATPTKRMQEAWRKLEEQKLLEKYSFLLREPMPDPRYELADNSEEAAQNLSDLLKQKYQETQEASFLCLVEAINANYDLSTIVKPEEQV
jgi:hypothetical protein